jgi:hypothetical protein
MRKNKPVLLAYLCEDGEGLKVWCPFCVRWHTHSMGFGHRTAHCSLESGSPFRETGYFLRSSGSTVTRRVREALRVANARLDRRG